MRFEFRKNLPLRFLTHSTTSGLRLFSEGTVQATDLGVYTF